MAERRQAVFELVAGKATVDQIEGCRRSGITILETVTEIRAQLLAGFLTAGHAQGRLESALKEAFGFDVAQLYDDDIEAAVVSLHEAERTRRILEIMDEAAVAAVGALIRELLGIRKRFAAAEFTVEKSKRTSTRC